MRRTMLLAGALVLVVGSAFVDGRTTDLGPYKGDPWEALAYDWEALFNERGEPSRRRC